MKIIHNYYPIYTRKLIEIGMAEHGDGFKISHIYKTPEKLQFNEVAEYGSELYEIVKEYASCFYIDRLQGGSFWFDYPFSEELLEEYDRLTEGNFLGLQVHELGTTRFLDWNRIKRCLQKDGLEWTETNIYEAVRAVSADKEFPHFSNGCAKEYAALVPPETLSEAAADISGVLKDRQDKYKGKILNCDAGRMYPRLEKENDIKTSFIEIGGQTPHTRVQFALRRGMSRVHGAKWGVYLEPWNNREVSAYCFMKDGINEWHMHDDNFIYHVTGENGGSSMSLARRMMFYALFAGADYFAEEWGMANTFYDWKDWELSPYGKHKKNMIEWSRKLTDVKPMVPIAIVLPEEYVIVSIHGKEPRENDVYEGEYTSVTDSINRLFDNNSRVGNEDMLFTVGRYGSLFDIIYEDSYENPENEYSFLVDFSGKYAGKSDCAVNGFDEAKRIVELDKFVTEYIPFAYEAERDIDYMLFESGNKKYCAFMNHNGVSKTQEQGEWLHSDAMATLDVTLKNGHFMEVFNICNCEYHVGGKTLSVTLNGGEFILFQYC